MSQQAFVEQVRSLCRQVRTLTLATSDAQGLPHAASLYFAPDGELDLYFVSNPQSAHARHIADRPQVAAALHPAIHMWQQIRGVQLRGICTPIDPNEQEHAWALYVGKYPEIAEAAELVHDSQFYRLRPNWIRWIDNSVHFGYRVESPWPPPQKLRERRGDSIW